MDVSSGNYFGKGDFVKELSPNDFDQVETWRLKNGKCCIILFYAPWCGYCKGVKDVWKQFAEKAIYYNVYAFNCEKHKTHLAKIQNDMPELVQGFPTIIIYKKGIPVEKIGRSPEERVLEKFITASMRVCGKE